MKVAQMWGTRVRLFFILPLLALLQSIPSLGAQMDVEVQAEPVLLGPPPEGYQKWRHLEELFDNAAIDDIWTRKEFEQAIIDGDAFRKSCIDVDGALHLIEVDGASLENIAKLLPKRGTVLQGFRFKNTSVGNSPCRSFEGSGVFKHNVRFTLCDLSHNSFKESVFEGSATFDDCDLSHSSFEGSVFTQHYSSFENCNLSDSSFERSVFKGLFTFKNCDLSDSSFEKSMFEACTPFKNCDLSYSSFKGSVFRDNANFTHCDLSHNSFRGSAFGSAYFRDCDLSYSSFKGDVFRDPANFENCNLSYSSFKRSVFSHLLWLEGCLFAETNFEQTEMREVNVTDNIPYKASFSGAQIGRALLRYCIVKLAGDGYFAPDSEPFPGAFLLRSVELRGCLGPSNNPITDCTIYTTPDFPIGLDAPSLASWLSKLVPFPK